MMENDENFKILNKKFEKQITKNLFRIVNSCEEIDKLNEITTNNDKTMNIILNDFKKFNILLDGFKKDNENKNTIIIQQNEKIEILMKNNHTFMDKYQSITNFIVELNNKYDKNKIKMKKIKENLKISEIKIENEKNKKIEEFKNLNAIVEFLVKENENKKLKISLLQEKIIETEKKNIFLENKLSTLNRDIFMDINNIEKKQKENIQNFEKKSKKI